MIDLSRKQVLISGGNPRLTQGIAASLQKASATTHLLNDIPHTDFDQAAANEALATFERIDTMIILPAYHVTGFFMEMSESQWDEALSANYERAVYLAQAAAKHMIDHHTQGSIIFISSVGIEMPMLQTSSYATSLAALHPLAKMAAVECGPYGIRVNTITCAWLDHDWSAPYLKDANAREAVIAGIPLGHIGTPEMLGDVCAFLASPLAAYITGSIIPVDGGYTLTRSAGTSPYPLN